jgi:hypothetical protein
MPIGAPLIFTPSMQQNLLTTQSPNLFSTNQNQSMQQSQLLQNGEANFLQLFTPLQTLDQMGGMLTNGTHLFEYPSQGGKRFSYCI